MVSLSTRHFLFTRLSLRCKTIVKLSGGPKGFGDVAALHVDVELVHLNRLLASGQHRGVNVDSLVCPSGLGAVTEVVEAEILDAGCLARFEAGFVEHVPGYWLAVFAREN